MNRESLFRLLLGAKIFLIIGIVATELDLIQFGERPAVAEGEEATTKPPAPRPDVSKDAKSRRSFLEGLLNMPEIDTTDVKKEELGRYLSLLERKRTLVEERINVLKARVEGLQSLETTVETKIEKLQEERRFFAESLQKEKDLKGERITKLIALYEKMEPKKAAPVFEQMNRDLVVSLFKELKQKQVTAILENMDPEKAVELSEYFGRIRSSREYDILTEMNRSLNDAFEQCRGLPKES